MAESVTGRVAWAILNGIGAREVSPSEFIQIVQRSEQDYRNAALSVLAAMRDPTEAMENAGWAAAVNQNSPNAVRDMWQAMIDEALK